LEYKLQSLLKISMILQTAFTVDTYVDEGLTFKLRCTVKVELSL
jgi:hypothetical protein